ncbi:ATP-binding cassette domain-containing protein [Aquimarina algiphila]|uniref:ABC transporter ATP-binding protein n=1 Tax=Aquimarina algiphila TaxID=2047982 RepID=A0A554VPG8_9FLAO|nr:ABC transporter ATP-binding protein [Aquimarina algiphila]TSE10367.1 ABC transporter ATP-binding protein [Aquimarina algiphila]
MIHFKNIRFYYPKGKTILDDISLDFVPGNIYGVFGKNGEGKSTLMKIVAGLLFPKSGKYHVMGEAMSRNTVKYLQHMFIVPEDFELPGIKISSYEHINSPFYPEFSREQFYELLKEFKLSPDEKISTLSFGQKKKVLIAFGVATNTKLLLMDEPTNGLDIPSKSQFRKIMASVVDQGKCVVISTHQIRDLHSLINHIVILDQSKVAFDQPLSTISECLWFGKTRRDSNESIIYSEASFGGKTILSRQDKDETEVDLELLFNAVLNEPVRISNAIKNTHHDSAV